MNTCVTFGSTSTRHNHQQSIARRSGQLLSTMRDTDILTSPADCLNGSRTITAPPALLLAMISLGCYYAQPEAHALAVAVHPVLRGRLFTSTDFKPRAELWVHQALRLILLFGARVATVETHEMAHVLWGSGVTIGRRSGIFSQRVVAVTEGADDDLEAEWTAWIEEESSKRVGYFAFVVDVQRKSFPLSHLPRL